MYDELIKRIRQVAEEVCEDYDVDPYNAEQRCLAILQAADAIEELQQQVEHYHGCMNDWFEAAQEYEAAVPKWISVKEQLPKEADGMVFVLMPDVFPYNSKQPFVDCDQDRRIDMAHYSEHSKTWYFGDCGAVGGQEPIAWIYRNALPEPPKEDA